MTQGVEMIGLYVRDQDEALAFYVDKLGFRVHTDVRNGDFRWLTVQHPEQPSFQLGLFVPGPPTLDAASAQALKALVAKGAMPPMLLTVQDCRAAYERHNAHVRATVPQEMTELMSHWYVASGFAARYQASTDSTNDV